MLEEKRERTQQRDSSSLSIRGKRRAAESLLLLHGVRRADDDMHPQMRQVRFALAFTDSDLQQGSGHGPLLTELKLARERGETAIGKRQLQQRQNDQEQCGTSLQSLNAELET